MIFSLHVLGSRRGGGAERFFLRLVSALAESGQRTEAVIVPGSWIDAQLPKKIVRHYIGMRSPYDPVSRWRLRRLIKREAPHIVQTWMGRATRLVRLPAGRTPIHIARLGGFYDLKDYRHAHAWIGNTEDIRDHILAGGFPARHVFKIGNFVDMPCQVPHGTIAATRGRFSIPSHALLLLAAGRLHPNKGFEDLLNAFALLPTEIDSRPLHLLILGDGPLRDRLQEQCRRSTAVHRVHWAGWVDDVATCYQAADIFICPSRHEPLGNVILEAWAHGLPVIATKTSGAKELIRENINGLIVPVERPEALAQAIQKLACNAEARRKFSERGRQEVESRFSRNAVIKAYLSMYRTLIEEVS